MRKQPHFTHYIITKRDGSIATMWSAIDPHECIAKWPPGAQAEFAGATIRRLDPGELPKLYRNAWRDDGQSVAVDMQAARDVHRDHMRVARAPLLKQLDVDYQRADEAGDAERKKEIAAHKQQLRDCTQHPDIEAAQTPEELANVWPELPTPEAAAPPKVKARETPEPPPLPPVPIENAQPVFDRTFNLRDLLQKADNGEPPVVVPMIQPPAELILQEPQPAQPASEELTDIARRRAAKALVRQTVADVNRVTSDQRLLYEQAMMVLNKNVDAMKEAKIAAAADGVTVEEFASRVVAQYEARGRRALFVSAEQSKALRAIDAATGDEIDDIASEAARVIRGDDDAASNA